MKLALGKKPKIESRIYEISMTRGDIKETVEYTCRPFLTTWKGTRAIGIVFSMASKEAKFGGGLKEQALKTSINQIERKVFDLFSKFSSSLLHLENKVESEGLSLLKSEHSEMAYISVLLHNFSQITESIEVKDEYCFRPKELILTTAESAYSQCLKDNNKLTVVFSESFAECLVVSYLREI